MKMLQMPDSLHGFDAVRNRTMDTLDTYFAYAVDFLGKENVIMKPHPKSRTSTSADINLYKSIEVPTEILSAGMDDLNNRVLIL